MYNSNCKSYLILLVIVGNSLFLSGCDRAEILAPLKVQLKVLPAEPESRAAPAQGLSRSDLIDQYGDSKGVMNVGSKEVLLFDEGSVTLVDDRVVDVDWRSAEEMTRIEKYRSAPQFADMQIDTERGSHRANDLRGWRADLAGLKQKRSSLINRRNSLQSSVNQDRNSMEYHKDMRGRRYSSRTRYHNWYSDYHDSRYDANKSDANKGQFSLN